MAEARHDGAALRVLTNRALLHAVFRFAPTVEELLAAFERAAWAKIGAELENRAAGGIDSLQTQEIEGLPPPNPLLAPLSDVAVFVDDREALEVLMHVNSCPRHGKTPRNWKIGAPMAAAIRYRCFKSLPWIAGRLDHYGIQWRDGARLMQQAVKARDTRAMAWVYRNVRCETMPSVLADNSAEQGHLDVIRWFHDHRINDVFSARAMDVAAGAGRLDVVEFLSENRSEGCTTEAMDRAATAGFLEVVRFLHYYRGEGCTTQAMDGAAKYGHIEVVRFLHYHRREGCSPLALNYTATNGHFAVLKFLVDHRAEGCLFEAWNCSKLRGFKEQADFLSSRTKHDLMVCSVRMHATPSWLHPRRRCQVARSPSDRALSDDEDDHVDSLSVFPWCASIAACLK